MHRLPQLASPACLLALACLDCSGTCSVNSIAFLYQSAYRIALLLARSLGISLFQCLTARGSFHAQYLCPPFSPPKFASALVAAVVGASSSSYSSTSAASASASAFLPCNTAAAPMNSFFHCPLIDSSCVLFDRCIVNHREMTIHRTSMIIDRLDRRETNLHR